MVFFKFQSTDYAVKLIETRIRTTKKRQCKDLSVRSVFRELRANEALSLIGDYPLLFTVVEEVRRAGFEVRRRMLYQVMRESEELCKLSFRSTLVTLLLDNLTERPETVKKSV